MTKLADMHVHSRNSHDAVVPVLDLVRAELAAGVTTVAIADHWDGFRTLDGGDQDLYSHILACYEEVRSVRNEIGNACELLMSIELGEPHWDKAAAEKALALVPYDSVIGSVHAVRCPELEGCTGLDRAYSRMDFAGMSDADLDRFFHLYFDETLTMVRTVDMDILAHLGSPRSWSSESRGEIGTCTDTAATLTRFCGPSSNVGSRWNLTAPSWIWTACTRRTPGSWSGIWSWEANGSPWPPMPISSTNPAVGCGKRSKS